MMELENPLRAEAAKGVGGYNHVMAALVGAAKDASEAAGSGLRVEAPILAAKNFERVEVEGWRQSG